MLMIIQIGKLIGKQVERDVINKLNSFFSDNKQNNRMLYGIIVYNTVKSLTDTKGSSVMDFKCVGMELIIEMLNKYK